MAIIQCPECGGNLSSMAKQCVHCGAPIGICSECKSVFSGEGDLCPECHSKIINHKPAPIEATLDNFNTESVYNKIQKSIPGGLKFLFCFFPAISCFFILLSLLCPLMCGMLLPAFLQDTVSITLTPLLATVAFFTLVTGSGILIFKEMTVYRKLRKQVGDYDLNARIARELVQLGNDGDDVDVSFKKKNIKTLISAQSRVKNVYLRILQYIVAWIFYLVFGIPMSVIGWGLWGLPIVLASSILLANMDPQLPAKIADTVMTFITGFVEFLANPAVFVATLSDYVKSILPLPFSAVGDLIKDPSVLLSFIQSTEFICIVILAFLLITFIAYATLLVAVIVIYLCINSTVKKKICSNWVKRNIPDQIETYYKSILNEKFKAKKEKVKKEKVKKEKVKKEKVKKEKVKKEKVKKEKVKKEKVKKEKVKEEKTE